MQALSLVSKILSNTNEEKENMKQESLTRRGFLKGGAVAVGALATGGLISGCQPKVAEPQSAVDQSPTSSAPSTRYPFETPPPAIAENKIVKTLEAEIVICGAGQAGMLAALTAAEGGAKTIVLQKSSTIRTHGRGAAGCNTALHKAAGAHFDPAQYMSQLQMEASGKADPKIMRTWFEQSGETIDYINNLVKDDPKSGFVLGGEPTSMTISWKNAIKYHRQQTMIETLLPMAEKFGAEFIYNTEVEQLEREKGGRVTAVIAKGKDGYIRVKASKGIILATGDISHDLDMLEKYCPYITDVVNINVPPDNTGGGHKAAMWIGAQMERPPHGQMVHYDPTPLPEGDAPFSGNPYLAVNQNGERFMDENLSYQFNVLTCSRQPGQVIYQIIDGSLKKNWEKFVGTGYRRSAVNATSEEAWQTGLKNKAILQANTLEELAGLINVPKDIFTATCQRYQQMVENGKDEDYGKDGKLLAYTPVKDSPFFAIKRKPGILTTLGGLHTTPRLEVLDTENKIIEGLYAAGNVVGLCFGYDYAISIGGISCGRAMCFGRVAAKSALGTLENYKW
jgi:fumarate reductase flavoprotein subunit